MINIYTDGSCSGNPGPGGWAAILTTEIGGREYTKEISGGVPHTTNQRMELTAAVEALKAVKPGSEIVLISDSEYVVKGMNEYIQSWIARGWLTTQRKPVLNTDLWQQLLEVAGQHQVTFKWVRGHGNDTMNTRVDGLARAACEEIKSKILAVC
jgi:ribonuclease HI